jgi:hypothetical protein
VERARDSQTQFSPLAMLLQRHRAIESIGNDAKLTDVETQTASATLALMDLDMSGVSIADVSRLGMRIVRRHQATTRIAIFSLRSRA